MAQLMPWAEKALMIPEMSFTSSINQSNTKTSHCLFSGEYGTIYAMDGKGLDPMGLIETLKNSNIFHLNLFALLFFSIKGRNDSGE